MLFALIKKDFLIIKKYALIMLAVIIVMPPFMLWRVPAFAGTMGFVLSVIFAIFMLVQFVLQKENQFSKAAAFIGATPYPRTLFVLSKYFFCICIFIGTCIIFYVETLLLPELGTFNWQMSVTMFFVISIFFGVYFPVYYRLGYEKTKFAFFIVIMFSAFVFPQFLKMDNGPAVRFLNTIEPVILYGGIVLTGMLILVISASVSVHFYSRTDLS